MARYKLLLFACLLSACVSDATIRIVPLADLDSIEVVSLTTCPPGGADDIAACRLEVRHSEVIAANGTATLPVVEQGVHAVAVLGYRGCRVVGYRCAAVSSATNVELVMVAVDPNSVPRCSGQCGAEQSCLRMCGGTSGDDDLDGIRNQDECASWPACEDFDQDGRSNHRDVDADGDGYLDQLECPAADRCDHNPDGVPDFLQVNPSNDYDGDGVSNSYECWHAIGDAPAVEDRCFNTDTDRYPDYRDPDADDDGMSDRIECPWFAEQASCPRGLAGNFYLNPQSTRCGPYLCDSECVEETCCQGIRGPQRFWMRPRPVGDVSALSASPPMGTPMYGEICGYPGTTEFNWGTTQHPIYITDIWVEDGTATRGFLITYNGPDQITTTGFPPGFPTTIIAEVRFYGVF